MRRLATALTGLLLGACAAPEEEPPPPPGPAQRKRMILLAAEAEIHQLLGAARREMGQMSEGFLAEVDAAPRAFRLSSSDPELATYGTAAQAERRIRVEQVEERAKASVTVLLEKYETALWDAARRASARERGADLGSRTGYIDLDEKVDAAMVQLERDANLEQIDQAATLKLYEDVMLERELRLEVPGLGILSLFKSPPTLDLFAPRQEAQAVALAFVRGGLPPEVPLTFVQAERGRLERGGLLLTATPWQLDAGGGGTGVLPLRADIDARASIATEVLIPSVDVASPTFPALRDHVVVREYRTILRRDDTGETLATIGWQVRWNVDARGYMRVLVDSHDLVLPGDRTVPALLRAAAPQQ
jgi:hypothetical protein